MAEFLELSELKKLTGRPQKSKQIAWLRAEGIPFRVSATGHPVVTWSAVNSQSASTTAPAPKAKWRPRALQEA